MFFNIKVIWSILKLEAAILSPSLLNTSVLEYGYVYEEAFNEEAGTRLSSESIERCQ